MSLKEINFTLTPNKLDNLFDLEFLISLPAFVTNIVGTLKLPYSSVIMRMQSLVRGNSCLPLSNTPSISNIKPKFA